MVETLAPHTCEKAFTDRIRLRGVIGCVEELNGARRCHSGETRSKFAIVIVSEIFGALPIGRSFSQRYALLTHLSASASHSHG